MILIVADTGPLNYLIQIGHIEVLGSLTEKTVIPAKVHLELLHSAAPEAVRKWALSPPEWVEIRSPSQTIAEKDISAADSEGLALAKELNASFLLMDDRLARRCAARHGVATMGTVGLLEVAARRGLLSLRPALEKLRTTSCYLTDELIENAVNRSIEGTSK